MQSLLLICCLSVSVFLGCSGTGKIDTSTAEGAYKLAQTYEKDERFEEAATYYREVKNKHPYSRFATLSELALADIEFQREAYPEAEANYRLFKELHPSHEKTDYVTYRLALSIFNQIPSTIDRDLADARRALIYFDEVISSFPDSEFAKPAKEHRDKALKMLAEKEAYIAEFYFKREHWISALGRYKDLLKNPAELGYEKRALLGAALSAHRMKERDEAKVFLVQLEKKYPKSSEYKQARQEILND